MYTKSMESCPLVISPILAEFHPERATYTTFFKSLLLNGLSKSAQTFTVGFVKLPATHPIHIVVWGNFPFKRREPKKGELKGFRALRPPPPPLGGFALLMCTAHLLRLLYIKISPGSAPDLDHGMHQ